MSKYLKYNAPGSNCVPKQVFKKILVANRGEIACRIIRTLKKLNICSVAVYSEFDFNAPHVLMADEAICIGKSPLSDSYLNAEAIIEAAIKSNSDAVHPGFGFFSENAKFAESLMQNKIEFIGPNHHTIALMSNKINAKKLAKKSGVAVIEGYLGEIEDTNSALKVVESIGLPVLIKAAGGGGGKGMRIVCSYSDLAESVVNAKNEALKNFADGQIFIEKYIEKPRHIEIQVLSDKHGNIVCLGERECSIQRRYQKIIEEAPSAFVTEEMRQKMYEESVKLVKGVQYYSAGTIEYIVDQERNFYFMEMNTRIQVEHTVTEMITGIDIVEEMINIALGKNLPFKQKDIKMHGHALEARIYSENPEKNFLPTTGFITEYKEPKGPNIRVDSGVCEGIGISTYYDAMIAKVCVHDLSREAAIEKMNIALDNLVVDGVVTNIVFLQSVFRHSEFILGNIYTGFVADFYENGLIKDFKLPISAIKIFLSIALDAYCSKQLLNFTNFTLENKKMVVILLNKKINVEVSFQNGILVYLQGSKKHKVDITYRSRSILLEGRVNNDCFIARCKADDWDFNIEYAGIRAVVRVLPEEIQSFYDNYDLEAKMHKGNCEVRSPITGVISKIHVKIGSEVRIGDPLFVIESMKMENTFSADLLGIISKIAVQEGNIVQEGDLIIEYSNNAVVAN